MFSQRELEFLHDNTDVHGEPNNEHSMPISLRVIQYSETIMIFLNMSKEQRLILFDLLDEERRSFPPRHNSTKDEEDKYRTAVKNRQKYWNSFKESSA
jgi:hypothetical protein